MTNTNSEIHKLNVGIVQLDISWENRECNFQKYDALIPSDKNYDLIILPEMFSSGFSVSTSICAENPEGESFKWLQKKAISLNSAIASSIAIVENNKIYNRFYFIFPDGTYLTYNKNHLFSYGGEHLMFTKGKDKVIINYKGWKILPMVCYDLRFPVWNSNRFIDNQYDYDLAIYVANWPEVRNHAWQILLQARAIENQCWVLAANRVGLDGKGINHSGNSAIVNPYGEIIHSVNNAEAMIEGVVDLDFLNSYREKFGVADDWDKFTLL